MDRVRPYFISADQFRLEAAPQTPLPYVFPEQVSRDNYLGFITEGFILARGNEQYHRDHWGLVRKYTGFQWSKTLNIFLEAGGWDILSVIEKQNFTQLAGRIRQHTDTLAHLSEGEWRWRFTRSLYRVQDDFQFISNKYEGLNPMEALNKLIALRRSHK